MSTKRKSKTEDKSRAAPDCKLPPADADVPDAYRMLFDTSPVPMSLSRLSDGLLIDVNNAFCDMFGYSREAVVGHTTTELGLYADTEREVVMQRLTKSDFRAPLEIGVRSASNVVYQTCLTMWPVTVNGEKCVFAFAIDVTNLRIVQEELRQATDVSNAILNATSDYVAVLDRNAVILSHNDLLPAVVEDSRQDLRGMLAWDLLPEETTCARKRAFDQVVETGRTIRIEDCSGSQWTDSVLYPITDHSGMVYKVLVIARDITARKATETKLRLREQAFESSPVAFIMTDMDGVFTYVNRAMVDLLEYTDASSITGRSYSEFAVDREYAEGRFRVLLKAGRWSGEMLLKKADGNSLTVELFATVTRNRVGQAEGITISLLDISRRKEAEQELLDYRNRLEDMVLARTEALRKSNQELKQEVEERKRAEAEAQRQKERSELLSRIVPSAVFTVDLDRRITSWNDRAAIITGYSRAETLGKPCTLFAALPCTEKCGLFARDVETPVFGKECTIVCRDGEQRVVSKNCDLLRDIDGRVIGGIESFDDITARKHTENQLRESRARYRAIVENQVESICRWLPDRKLTYVNGEYAALFGASPNSLIGKDWIDFIPESARDDLRRHVREMVKNPRPVAYEHDVEDKAGQKRWFQWTDTPIMDENGNLMEFLSVGRDITARKTAETQLDITNRVLEILNATTEKTNQIRDIVFLLRRLTGLDAVGVRLQEENDYPYYVTAGFPGHFVIAETRLCESAATAMPGHEGTQASPLLECLCGRVLSANTDQSMHCYTDAGTFWTNCMSDLVKQNELDGHLGKIRGRCATEGYESVALIPLRANREIVGLLQLNDKRKNFFDRESLTFFEHIASCIGIALVRKQAENILHGLNKELDDKNRKLAELAAGLEDRVNERTARLREAVKRRSEMALALRESEKRYRTVADFTYDWEYWTDPDGNIMYTSPSCERVTGYSREAFEADPHLLWKIVTPEMRSVVAQHLAVPMKETEICEMRFDIRHKNGELRHISHLCRPVYDESTRTYLGKRGSNRDVTDQVSAETAAREQKEQLIQADKMVSLGTLVSGVAHEVNNPTNAIMLNAPLLKDAFQSVLPILDEYADENGDFMMGGMPYSEMKENMQNLFEGVIAGSKRIQTIVKELSDFARRDVSLENENVDLNRVVSAAVSLNENLIKKHTDRFFVSYGKALPFVSGSAQKLEQVVINLLQNACQALTAKSESITITTDHEKETGLVTLTVKDEGSGITPEVLQRITDPFFTTKRGHGGTGLGLTVSSKIVSEHGGSMTFSSVPEMGTTALVRLPTVTPVPKEDL